MAREVRLVSRSPEQTRRIAATVAGALRLGDVVALTGELGAGKTCFVQGAAAALGVPDRVTSPSFVLRREYQGRVPVLHLDVYRLSTLQEALDIGYEEALDRDWVTFIEWGDAMSPLLPVDHLEVEFRLPEPDQGPGGVPPRVRGPGGVPPRTRGPGGVPPRVRGPGGVPPQARPSTPTSTPSCA
ncbi:MAG: tRNA (adenosine(37)-N6)-threonylcarbamoyltransferase complex ATPase subunit type 1 TsaE [Egibacteraceae bacterium]